MTTFTDEVRQTVSPHKFGNDRMAAALYLLSLDGYEDEATGEAEWTEGYVARFGKRLLTCDSQGFIYCERFASDLEAISRFEAIDRAYGETLEQSEAEAEAWADGYRPDCDTDEGHFCRGTAVWVDGHPGIAWRVTGYPTRRLPDYEWTGIEWHKIAWRTVVMVGDDREHEFCVFDLHYLRDEEFCGTCGQIGCPWH